MKTSSPRWTCRLVRQWRALGGEPAPGHGFGARHLAGCTDCQRFFAASDALDSTLRRQAATLPDLSPTGLDQRILQAVTRSTAASEPAPRSRFFTFALAGTMAAAAVVIGLLQLRPGAPAGTAPNSMAGPADIVASTTPADNATTGLAAGSWRDLAAPVTNLLERDPLQAEVDSVVAGARWGVRFLALNFLPSDTAAGNSAPSRRSPDRADG